MTINSLWAIVVSFSPAWLMCVWWLINGSLYFIRWRRGWAFEDRELMLILSVVCLGGFGFYLKVFFSSVPLTLENQALARLLMVIILLTFSRANLAAVLTGLNGKWQDLTQSSRSVAQALFWPLSQSQSLPSSVKDRAEDI